MVEQAHLDDVLANSKLTFEDAVIAKIVGKTAQNIDGLLSMNGNFFSDIADRFRTDSDPTKGISVEVGEKQVAIDMTIILEYGRNARDVFERLTSAVTEAVESMTGLSVVEVNSHVSDVMTKKEWQQQGSNAKKSDNDDKRVQ
ncbi:Asp23/Gls24 family envelope stress response protein [Latilactobacillus sakei]